MTAGRVWLAAGVAGVVLLVAFSPALSLPGLRQGLPKAVAGALGVGGLVALCKM